MSVNAREEQYEHVELFGKPALFTDSRIDRSTVPEGFHCYDLRGSDYDPGKPVTLENQVAVNHTGTVLTAELVTIPKEGFRRLRGKLNFLGECLTLPEFCEEHGIALSPDNRKFILRPASPNEAGIFYALPKEQDAAGIEAAYRLKDVLADHDVYNPAYVDIEILQSTYKDWNEDLKALHGVSPIPSGEHPKLALLPEIRERLVVDCKELEDISDPNGVIREQLRRLGPFLDSKKPAAANRTLVDAGLRRTAAASLLA